MSASSSSSSSSTSSLSSLSSQLELSGDGFSDRRSSCDASLGHETRVVGVAKSNNIFGDLILSPRKLLDKLLIVCPNVDSCQEVLPRRDLQLHLLYRCKGSFNRCNQKTSIPDPTINTDVPPHRYHHHHQHHHHSHLHHHPRHEEETDEHHHHHHYHKHHQNCYRLSCSGSSNSSSSVTAHNSPIYNDNGRLFLTSRPMEVPEEQITRLYINRAGQALGITVVGGLDTPLVNVIIQEVYRNGVVYKDGRLKPGDQLVEVNGIDLTRATHLQAVQALSKSSIVCELVVFREPCDQGLTRNQKQEVLTVRLRKLPGKQLGIKLIQKKNLPGLYILEIIDGSVAFWDDRLRPEDQILEINETDMRNGTQDQAVDIIQNCESDVEFVVNRVFVGRTSLFCEEYLHVTSEKNGLSIHSIDYCTPHISWDKVISVNKREQDSLGISIAGGKFNGGYDTPIYVTNMQADGCIAKTGQILKGDVLIDINGTSLLNLTHNEVVEVLKSFSRSRRLVLHVVQGSETSEGPGNFRPSWRFWLSMPASCYSVKTLVIERSPLGSLGFSIVGGYVSRCGVVPVFVKSVVYHGPAGRDGKLRSGDMILSVNGTSLDGATHNDAVQLLTSDTSHVILTVVSWPGSLV